ncbi:CLUMA_CG005387, isoform A [Clunio marinus]|uniref:CLUMA_CG005387, isoform A n=1 Tax=Clunio marinus TaxID=568069 RepID=A0A1J1I043_9DIPT|nr:CLUMA_CG005387, isoform A [Clunio marinus]
MHLKRLKRILCSGHAIVPGQQKIPEFYLINNTGTNNSHPYSRVEFYTYLFASKSKVENLKFNKQPTYASVDFGSEADVMANMHPPELSFNKDR